MTADDTGIGLLVFDRPEHTKQVLNALKRNEVDKLYIFADGPEPDQELESIEATRDIVQNVDFCDVELIIKENNYGIQRMWIDAYDYIFENHKKAIILEDDCVPASDFVGYMQTCLDYYEDHKRVMNVQGYCPPIEIPAEYSYDVFFTWRSGSWGQGTWKNAWEKLRRDPSIRQEIKENKDLRRAVRRAGWDLIPMLEKEIDDEINSIGVWWSLTLARYSGVSVNPVRSRIKNIGHDGSGTHSSKTDRYMVEIEHNSSVNSLSFPPNLAVNDSINRRYNYHIGGRLRGRIGRFLERARRAIL